nr:hypothetical protein [Providencia rettgeri]
MDYLKLIWDGVAYFFKNLPQYAAILTASVAIILFLIKESKEKRKKEENKRERDTKKNEELKAIRTILGFEAYIVLKQVEFFIDLNRHMEGMTKIKIDIMPRELWRQVKIGYSKDSSSSSYSKFLMVPVEPNIIGHEFIVNAIQLEPTIFNDINMLNQSMLTLNTYIDSCIGYILNETPSGAVTIARLVADGNQPNGTNVMMEMLKIIYKFRKEMSNFVGFESLYSKINSHYNIDPDRI